MAQCQEETKPVLETPQLSINNYFHCHSTQVYRYGNSGSRKNQWLQEWPQWDSWVMAGKPFWIGTDLRYHLTRTRASGPTSPQGASKSYQEAHGGHFDVWRFTLAQPQKNLIPPSIARKNLIRNLSYLQLYSVTKQQRKLGKTGLQKQLLETASKTL